MKNIGVKYGLLGGLSVVFYFLLLYSTQKANFLNPYLQWGSMLFYVFCMYKAAQEDCVQNGIERDIREAIRTPFTVFLLINLFYWLFYYSLHLYDKSLVTDELNAQHQFIEGLLKSGTGDPASANKYREDLKTIEQALQHPIVPIGPILTKMCTGAIGGFGISSIIAAILRWKN